MPWLQPAHHITLWVDVHGSWVCKHFGGLYTLPMLTSAQQGACEEVKVSYMTLLLFILDLDSAPASCCSPMASRIASIGTLHQYMKRWWNTAVVTECAILDPTLVPTWILCSLRLKFSMQPGLLLQLPSRYQAFASVAPWQIQIMKGFAGCWLYIFFLHGRLKGQSKTSRRVGNRAWR